MTDERLRELYERALGARRADPAARAHCATPEAMHALVRRDGAESARLATLDHVMSCAECAREFELLRAVEAAGVATTGAATSRVGAAGRRDRSDTLIPWRQIAPFALAASLLLAVGIGVRGRRGGDDASDVMRGGPTAGERGALALVAPAATDTVRADSLVFIWRADPDARRYVLEVLAPAGGVVISRTTSDTSVTVRGSDLARVAPVAGYHWWVRSYGTGGAERASAVRPLWRRAGPMRLD